MAVDPELYEGNWTGKYADNKSFKISVSNVTGFRAKVQYQSGGTNKFQEVLIKDNSFRIGDTKFTLTEIGTAEIKNVVTDPVERRRRYLDHGLRQAVPLNAGRPGQLPIRPASIKPVDSGLAVGGAQARGRVLGQVEGVEIGAAAQHGFLGKLLDHLARPGIDDLIDDRRAASRSITTWFDTEALEMETRTASESVLARAPRPPPRRSGSAAVRSRPLVAPPR